MKQPLLLLDPSLIQNQLQSQSQDTSDQHLDPSLFVIEEAVNDIRRGKVHDDSLHDVFNLGEASMTHHGGDVVPEDHNQIQLDEEIDPALRAIVNSLTNAQQSHPGNGLGSNHLADTDERDRLEQSLQTTLDDLAQANYTSYGSLFPATFHQSPSGSNLLLPDHTSSPSSPSNPNAKRGRGRPKGSRNKPNPAKIRPPTPPPRSPKRPRGRPMKIRSPEEQAIYDRRKAEKEAGIRRKKGRPRKNPDYLVRDMRLKRNRELRRQLEAQEGGYEMKSDGMGRHHLDDDDVDMGEGEEYRDWEVGGGSFLDVVHGAMDTSTIGDHERAHHHHAPIHQDLDGGGDHIDEPSSQALGIGKDENMSTVFGLEVGLDSLNH